MEQFFDECCRMKAFKHPNVVELIGMCLDSPDGFPLMILPLYPHGNLKTYLQQKRKYNPFVTTLPEVSPYAIVNLTNNDNYVQTMHSNHSRKCILQQFSTIILSPFRVCPLTFSLQCVWTLRKEWSI